jgi:hypothetical protein
MPNRSVGCRRQQPAFKRRLLVALGACLPAGLITLAGPRNKRAALARAGFPRRQPRGFEMPQTLATLIGYILTGITPALAQATPGTTGDIPWIWIIAGIIVVGGIIWWYMRGRT